MAYERRRKCEQNANIASAQNKSFIQNKTSTTGLNNSSKDILHMQIHVLTTLISEIGMKFISKENPSLKKGFFLKTLI